jgi:hypothetical protein
MAESAPAPEAKPAPVHEAAPSAEDSPFEAAPAPSPSNPEVAGLLDYVGEPAAVGPSTVPRFGLAAARVTAVSGRRATVRFRRGAVVEVELASEVDPKLVRLAERERQLVLVDCSPDEPPCLIGVLQTRLPEVVTLRAAEVEIDASRSLTLRSGRAGLRLRADGEVELVGSRISAASRGLMRLVGRVLRLN